MHLNILCLPTKASSSHLEHGSQFLYKNKLQKTNEISKFLLRMLQLGIDNNIIELASTSDNPEASLLCLSISMHAWNTVFSARPCLQIGCVITVSGGSEKLALHMIILHLICHRPRFLDLTEFYMYGCPARRSELILFQGAFDRAYRADSLLNPA